MIKFTLALTNHMSTTSPIMIAPHPVIDQLVLAYNAGDAQAFSNLFSLNACVYEHPGQLTQKSRQELLAYYTNVFAAYPSNRTRVLYRVTTGNRVIDHERVLRSADHKPFEVISIYELDNDGLICRLDFVRKDDDIATV
jgi:hypothetical protein